MLRRAARLARALLAAIGLCFTLVTVTPVVNWWARALAGPWTDARGETLIVLGGSMQDDITIGASTYLRAVYAARAFRAGGFERVVVSGGGAGTPVSAAMRDFLLSQGIPAQAITIEAASLTTRENALFAAALLRGDHSRKILLTSDYHMYRAARSFAKAGLAVTPRPCPDALKLGQRWQTRWPAFQSLCIETTKVAYYRLRGWI